MGSLMVWNCMVVSRRGVEWISTMHPLNYMLIWSHDHMLIWAYVIWAYDGISIQYGMVWFVSRRGFEPVSAMHPLYYILIWAYDHMGIWHMAWPMRAYGIFP